MLTPIQKQAIRDAASKHTSVGIYPTFLLMSDGGCLCPDCVKAELRLIVGACRNNDSTGGWMPAAADVNWEDSTLYCDHCGEQIESAHAYGEAV